MDLKYFVLAAAEAVAILLLLIAIWKRGRKIEELRKAKEYWFRKSREGSALVATLINEVEDLEEINKALTEENSRLIRESNER